MTAPTLPPEAPAERRAGSARRSRRVPVRRAAGTAVQSVRSGLRSVRVPGVGPEIAGVLAALWAAAIGLVIVAVPMLVVWMASTASGLTWAESLRIAGLIWVVAQGTPVAISGVEITLLPWGLALIPLLLLAYAGGWAARRSAATSWLRVARIVVAGSVAYAAVTGLVAQASYDASSRASLLAAALHGLVLSFVGLALGAVRGARLLSDPRIPRTVLVSIRAGAAAAFVILGLGAIAVTASLMAHFDAAVTVTQSLGAGVGGGLALLLLSVAYVPVIVTWSAAYLLGAGVVVAPAVTVTPFIPAGAPADLPPLPVLAALPDQAPVFAWGLPLVGVLAGVLAGWHIARVCRSEPRLVRLVMAVGSAAVAGGLLAAASWLSSGALGTDRLAHLGPAPGTVGVLAAILVVLGAIPSAVAPGQPGTRRLRVARVAPAAPQAPAESAVAEPPMPTDADPPGIAPDESSPEPTPPASPVS